VTAAPTRIVVLSDTHLTSRTRRTHSGRPPGRILDQIPARGRSELDRADVILHAGDVVVQALLDALGGMAPTYAVLGNNDSDLIGVLPLTRTLELGGVPIAMIHDSGPTNGRPARMRRRFPDAAVVVYGHSHIPDDQEGIDGQRLFNPGSPTQRRSQPRHTLGVLELGDGRVIAHRILEWDG
jgi:uncharacterized protein